MLKEEIIDKNQTAKINNKAYILQSFGQIKNYYILIPIRFRL